jgi:hypothetical protein
MEVEQEFADIQNISSGTAETPPTLNVPAICRASDW